MDVLSSCFSSEFIEVLFDIETEPHWGDLEQYIKEYSGNRNMLLFLSEKDLDLDSNPKFAKKVKPTRKVKYNLLSSPHSWSVKGYDEKLGMVYLTNPHSMGEIVEMDIKDLPTYFRVVQKCDLSNIPAKVETKTEEIKDENTSLE